MEEQRILLLDENGNEKEFELVVTLDIEDKSYALMAEADNEASEDIFAFRIEDLEDGEMTLVPVEDEEEFEQVSLGYDQLMDSMMDDGHGCGCGHHHGHDHGHGGGCGC